MIAGAKGVASAASAAFFRASTPPEQLLRRDAVSTSDRGHDRATDQLGFDCALFVIRPAPATPPPVITSTRRTAAAFRSSLMSSVEHKPIPTSGGQNRSTPPRIEDATGRRLRSLGNVTRTINLPVLRAVAERLGCFPLYGSELGPTLPRRGHGAFIVTLPGSAGPT
jgi:hypothetical protein